MGFCIIFVEESFSWIEMNENISLNAHTCFQRSDKFQVILHVTSILSKLGRVWETITLTQKHTFMLLLLKQNVS